MQPTSQGSLLSAAMLMIAAMAIIGVIDNYIVVLAEFIGLWQFHVTRTLVALPLIAGLSLLGLGGLRPLRYWAVLLRAILLATAMMFYFAALGFMPIAQALAGLFSSPIFVLLITALALRKPVGPWRIGAVLLGFVGILLVLQPDPNAFDYRMLIPLCGGFFYALSVIVTRSLCAEESTVVLLGAAIGTLGLIGGIALLGLSLFPLEAAPGPEGFVARGWVWPMTPAIPFVLLQAVGSVIAVYMLTKAYQLAEPSYLSVFEYSIMIFGPLFAWVAFGQTLNAPQVLGIALIACAGITIALRSG
ncbi:MAG: DMT family transporter [Paracoccaceae bacterium]